MKSLLNAGQSTGAAGISSVDSSAITIYNATLLKTALMQRKMKMFIQPTAPFTVVFPAVYILLVKDGGTKMLVEPDN